MTPLWGDLVGPIPFTVRHRGTTIVGAFRLQPEAPPDPALGALDALLAFLVRAVCRWDGRALDAPQRRLGALPAQLLRLLAQAYCRVQYEPQRQLAAMWEQPDFRTSTLAEWQLLRCGLAGKPEPSPYLAAFCLYHLDCDERERAQLEHARLRYTLSLQALGVHAPKELHKTLTAQLHTDAPVPTPAHEETRRAEADAAFYAHDPVFGDKVEVPDFVLAQMAAGFHGD